MIYRAITVTLDDIGGVVFEKDRSGGTVATMFNVTIAGRRQYSVKMDGTPRLESDAVVTAVLRDPDNWQTLVGWLDHSTGQICGVNSPVKSLGSFVVIAVISAAFSIKWLGEALSGGANTVGTVVCLLAGLAMNAWALSRWRKSATVYKLVRP